ncbi:MAG TPA: tetratricopeptide repeat protein [Anaerolineae bacterium]|nr:tetratricopeptide repeat protein [Anaerolineae bacterium]
MADIALRDYVTEIESLIEGNAYDEAVVHCRHILGVYPKYLEAYRLLGKAALEKEDDRAALDIFERVLSVDPEDFVARIGLSIVRDRQDTLDEALWQMERGFELMPSNDVIQSELRRLYGRRDGAEPQHISLTRGALARMYARGDLYDEAIAELRALLRESPERLDLQVLLAETLWRNDQRNEAASVAEGILEKLPYCLTANLILGEIYLNSGLADEGEMLLRRAQATDPDNLRANALLGHASPLAEQKTTVERLERGPQFTPVSPEVAVDEVPEWLSGLAGLTLEQPESLSAPGLPPPTSGPPIELGPPTEGEIPEWLQSMELPAEPSAETPEWIDTLWQQAQAPAEAPVESAGAGAEPAPAGVQPGEPLPDWLQAGLSEMPELAEEGAPPDWLSEIPAPPVAETAEQPELPSWLSDLETSTSEVEQIEQEAPDLAQADVPDWLKALRPQVAEAPPPAVELPEVQESEIPDWMADLEQRPSADEAFDFLRRLGEGMEAEPEAPPVTEQPAQPAAPAEMGAMPSADEALAFLQGLTAGKEEQLVTEAERAAEERMDAIMGGKPGTSPLQPPPQVAPEAPPVSEQPAQPAAPAEMEAMPSADEALAFLQGLTAGQEEQLRTEAERAAEERMEAIMVGRPGTSPLQPPPQMAPEALPVSEQPAQPAAPAEMEAMPSADEALAFLESLTAGKEEQLRAEAERAGEERMDAIMGGKPGTSPLRPRPEPAPQEIEVAPEPEAAPLAEELLAADEALAFLQDLAAPPEAPSAGELEQVEMVEAPGVALDFWLQTAEDEGAEPIPSDYFERGVIPQPAVALMPEAAAMAPIGAEELVARLEADASDHEARLSLARVWWAFGDRVRPLALYQELVEEEAFLSEVAGDLQRNLESFPDAGWYRTLGDAHMKLGRLAEALNAYRQALAHL